MTNFNFFLLKIINFYVFELFKNEFFIKYINQLLKTAKLILILKRDFKIIIVLLL